MKKLITAIFLLISSSIANATPMTNLWTADVESHDPNGRAQAIFSGVTSVSWVVTFEDKGTEMHYFNTSHEVIDEWTYRKTPDYSFMSDATFFFDATLTSFFAYSVNSIEPEYFSTIAWAYKSTPGGQFAHYRNLNDAYLFARNGGSRYSEYGYASIQTSIDTHDTVYFSNLSVTEYSAVPIPEPTTFLLFGLGAGLLIFIKKIIARSHASHENMETSTVDTL